MNDTSAQTPSPLNLLFGPYGRVCLNLGDFESLLKQLAWLGRRCKHAVELDLPNTHLVRAAMASGLDIGALCLAAFTEGMSLVDKPKLVAPQLLAAVSVRDLLAGKNSLQFSVDRDTTKVRMVFIPARDGVEIIEE